MLPDFHSLLCASTLETVNFSAVIDMRTASVEKKAAQPKESLFVNANLLLNILVNLSNKKTEIHVQL